MAILSSCFRSWKSQIMCLPQFCVRWKSNGRWHDGESAHEDTDNRLTESMMWWVAIIITDNYATIITSTIKLRSIIQHICLSLVNKQYCTTISKYDSCGHWMSVSMVHLSVHLPFAKANKNHWQCFPSSCQKHFFLS